ncbi:hypothetical protein Cpir12675_005912, partial [Ceratocystis pirilliformis]
PSFDSYQAYEAIANSIPTPLSLGSISPSMLSVDGKIMHCQTQYHEGHRSCQGCQHKLTTPPLTNIWSNALDMQSATANQSSPSMGTQIQGPSQAQPQPQVEAVASVDPTFNMPFIVPSTNTDMTAPASYYSGYDSRQIARPQYQNNQQQEQYNYMLLARGQNEYPQFQAAMPAQQQPQQQQQQSHAQPSMGHISVGIPSLSTAPRQRVRGMSSVATPVIIDQTARVSKKASKSGSRTRGGRNTSISTFSGGSSSSFDTTSIPPHADNPSRERELTPPLKFKDNTPKSERQLLSLRRKYKDLKGTRMWDQIIDEFIDPAGKENKKAALQMRINRSKKYLVWPKSEEEILLQAYIKDEEQRYLRILNTMQKLGSGSYMPWSAVNVEAKLAELGLESVYVNPETNLRSRPRPPVETEKETGERKPRNAKELADFYRAYMQKCREQDAILGDEVIDGIYEEVMEICVEEAYGDGME